MRSFWIAAAPVFCAFALAWSTLAAEGPGELIIVTPTEGKSVTGELVRANAANVVVRVPGDTPQEVTLPWDKIKRVSNGLTREKATTAVLADAAKRCPVCGGKAVVKCPKCGGKARLTDLPKIQCPVCRGEGISICTAKGCQGGKVPCPASCLKLTEGKWEKGPKDMLWRKIPVAGGIQMVSQQHLGDLIVMENGAAVNKGKCPTCNGTTTIECPLCQGTGKATCPECKGEKMVFRPCPDCKDGTVLCAACKGTGVRP